MKGKVKVLENVKVTSDIYLMKVALDIEVKAGQFFMLKVEYSDTVLYRPISIFNSEDGVLSFLYMVRGKGTSAFSKLIKGDYILIHGPYGNGFPVEEKKVALVGGGIGIAPLYLCAIRNPKAVLYFGVRENRYSKEELANLSRLFTGVSVFIKEGGSIIDEITFNEFDAVYSCGPTGMMKAISHSHEKTYVSLENHMGCGVGACLSCSCKTVAGMKKTCKDGPVFLAEEVAW